MDVTTRDALFFGAERSGHDSPGNPAFRHEGVVAELRYRFFIDGSPWVSPKNLT